jgi:hypothetical protein
MVRQIEKVLEARIEKRRLPEFNYGDFKPESQFSQQARGQRQNTSQRNRKPRHRRSQRSRTYNAQKSHT